MNRATSLLAGFALFLAGVGHARADLITQTDTLISDSVTPTISLPFSDFNSYANGGTLTGVQLTVAVSANTSYFIRNNFPDPTSYLAFSFVSTLTVSGPGIDAVATASSTVPGGTIGGAEFGGTIDGSMASSQFVFDPTSQTPPLSGYLNAGPIAITFPSFNADSSNTLNTNLSFSLSPAGSDLSGTVTLQYTYTPAVASAAPEPATNVIVLTTLAISGGYLGMRKRFKKPSA